jgi:pathogenesis-related protein 1
MFACAADDVAPPVTNADADELKGTSTAAEPASFPLRGIVAAHNRVRASVTPAPAKPLVPLRWSETNAAVARKWAARCEFEHSTNTSLGENLSAQSGTGITTDIVVGGWASEEKDYSYADNFSNPKAGHYTQIIWGATTHVGCAVQKCSINNPFADEGEWELVVCNYSPPGNYRGKRPY